MSAESKPHSIAHTEATLSEFMLYEDHPGDMTCARMGAQICRLLELLPDQVPDDSEFRTLHPIASPDSLKEFSTNLAAYQSSIDLESAVLQAKSAAIHRYNTTFRETATNLDSSTAEVVGRGRSSVALGFTLNGKLYVARKISTRLDAREVEKHFSAALLVEDIDHMEHVEAISYRDSMTIALRAPGNVLKKLNLDDLSAITADQIEAIYTAMNTANDRDVYFDGYGDNFLYHSTAGFTAVDMSVGQDGVHVDAATALDRSITRLTESWIAMRNDGTKRGRQLYRIIKTIRTTIEASDPTSETLRSLDELGESLSKELRKYELFEQSVATHEASRSTK